MSSPTAHTSEDDLYVLKRDAAASVRLNTQHVIWHRGLGYNIHPSIKLPEAPHIADLACGTGMWLLEVSEENPSATCDGFDISLAQAPDSSWVNSSVRFHKLDMMATESVSTEFEGKYDLVHIRLVTLVLNEDPTPVIKTALRLLKPGGVLQWDEYDFDHPLFAKRHENNSVGAWQKLHGIMKARSCQEWYNGLPEFLTHAGFEDARRETQGAQLSMIKFATDVWQLVWDEVISGIPNPESKRNFSQLIDACRKEAADGVGFTVGYWVVIARKRA